MRKILIFLICVVVFVFGEGVSAMDVQTKEQAIVVAKKVVEDFQEKTGTDLVLREDCIHEYQNGWLVSPLGKKYSETGDEKDALLGGPYFFITRGGKTLVIPVYAVVRHVVDEYVENNSK
jgi:hypothetical protein